MNLSESSGRISRSMSLSSRLHLGSVTAFRNHVLRVVCKGAQEEMRRIDTVRPVAPMQNVQPIGDVSVVKLPREAVRRDKSGLSTLFVGEQDAMPLSADPIACGRPEPTATAKSGVNRAGFVDLLPKAFSDWTCPIRIGASRGTEDTPASYIALLAGETIAALWADARDLGHMAIITICPCGFNDGGAAVVPGR
jgi:hypothetical protein